MKVEVIMDIFIEKLNQNADMLGICANRVLSNLPKQCDEARNRFAVDRGGILYFMKMLPEIFQPIEDKTDSGQDTKDCSIKYKHGESLIDDWGLPVIVRNKNPNSKAKTIIPYITKYLMCFHQDVYGTITIMCLDNNTVNNLKSLNTDDFNIKFTRKDCCWFYQKKFPYKRSCFPFNDFLEHKLY